MQRRCFSSLRVSLSSMYGARCGSSRHVLPRASIDSTNEAVPAFLERHSLTACCMDSVFASYRSHGKCLHQLSDESKIASTRSSSFLTESVYSLDCQTRSSSFIAVSVYILGCVLFEMLSSLSFIARACVSQFTWSVQHRRFSVLRLSCAISSQASYSKFVAGFTDCSLTYPSRPVLSTDR